MKRAATMAILLGLWAGTLPAETLLLDSMERGEQASQLPSRGMTMDRVEAAFGAPLVKHRAVGDPPITRWEYDSFVVYFEYQRVLHSVSKRQARAR